MKFKSTLITAALLLSISSAQAALVETDWKTEGDALATLDTETGIEWLDLTQTDGMSINQAEGLTGEGGAFEGWRFPTHAEVIQMLVSALPSQASTIQSNSGPLAMTVNSATTDNEADSFRTFFGHTYVTSTHDFSYGMVKNDSGQAPGFMYGLRDVRSDDSVMLYLESGAGDDYNFSHAIYGVYLVSDGGTTLSSKQDPGINANNANAPAVANVSAPALLSLAGLGMLGFAARRRSHTTYKNNK